jgi:hypothetical protein
MHTMLFRFDIESKTVSVLTRTPNNKYLEGVAISRDESYAVFVPSYQTIVKMDLTTKALTTWKITRTQTEDPMT